MSDSSEGWLLTLKRLRREQTTAEAAVARKPRSTRPPRTRASRVVRPAFATLAQHFNQGSDTRSLVVRPDLPQESLSRGQPRGIGVVSGSPRERPQGDYHQVGVEVVREGRREFVYYLLISADEAGIAVRKVVTDADAEQSEANAGVKAAPPSGHLSGDAHRQQSGLSRKVGDEGQQWEVFRSDIQPLVGRGRASPQVRKNKVVLINDFLAEYATFYNLSPS